MEVYLLKKQNPKTIAKIDLRFDGVVEFHSFPCWAWHLLASLGVTDAVFIVHLPERLILLEQTTCGKKEKKKEKKRKR